MLVTSLPVQVMPFQEQGVLVVFQLVLSVQLVPPVLLYSESKALHWPEVVSVTVEQLVAAAHATDVPVASPLASTTDDANERKRFITFPPYVLSSR
jgi:hypothetical protein